MAFLRIILLCQAIRFGRFNKQNYILTRASRQLCTSPINCPDCCVTMAIIEVARLHWQYFNTLSWTYPNIGKFSFIFKYFILFTNKEHVIDMIYDLIDFSFAMSIFYPVEAFLNLLSLTFFPEECLN